MSPLPRREPLGRFATLNRVWRGGARELLPRAYFGRRLSVLAAALWTTFVAGRLAAAAPIKVACVGDSITAGTAASSSAHAYPEALSTLAGSGWDVVNFGNGGKTMVKMPSNGASYWSQVQFTESQSFNPDIVTIMLGTNDSKTTNWNGGNNTFEADYRSMVAVYQGLPSHPRVYAMLPPPALSSSFSISSSVIQNQIIPIIRRVAAATGIGIIDINAAVSANHPATLLSSDGIHPNDAGYLLIAQTVWGAIQRVNLDGGLAEDAATPPPTQAPAAAQTDANGVEASEDATANVSPPQSVVGPGVDDASAPPPVQATADVQVEASADFGPDSSTSDKAPNAAGSSQSSPASGCTCHAVQRQKTGAPVGAVLFAGLAAGLRSVRRRNRTVCAERTLGR